MWLNKVLQTLLILFTLICFSSTYVYKFRKRIEKISNSTYKYKTKYFEVPVDHFNYVNKDVFKIRYLINDDHWVPESGAPIFFYTGNEGDIEWFAENTGFVWEIAPEFKALIVFAEHRYYGKSLPYGNQSYSDIRHWGYLTADQAMADFVDLITYLRSHQSDRPRSKRSPVIAFGGSYGGMLAAWIRMKYPAAVAGSLAASAPIWQFTGMTPCETFMRVTTSAYEITGKHCPSNIRATWKELTKLIQTEDGRKWLSTNWTLCKPLKNETDGYALKEMLNGEIINVAMANYPYPANFLGSLPGHPVKKFCQHLSAANLKGKELLGAVYNGLKVWFNHTGQAKCLNWDTTGPITLDVQGWDHQSCAEMVMPICSNGVNDMFEPDPWNLNNVVENCKKAYNITTRPYFVGKQYGGRHLEAASNIIFSNGLLDPWSSGGVLKNVSKSCVAVLIPEGAHHLDLRSSNKLDPASVTKARKYYKVLFKQWIKNFREHS